MCGHIPGCGMVALAINSLNISNDHTLGHKIRRRQINIKISPTQGYIINHLNNCI